METISNLASTVTSTASNLIYGNQDTATKTNETAGLEPVSGQTGKGTVDEPYDQGNSEVALDKNTTSTTGTGIESSKVTEPAGSIQKPEDLIKAYNTEAGDVTTTTGASSSATGITDKAGVTEQIWKPTDVDAVKPSVTDPAAAPETGAGAETSTGKDTLWRGVDAYKDTSSSGPDAGTGVKPLEPTSTSTGSTITGSEPTRLTSGESTTGGPKGDIDAEPRNYSIGDLTSGKETPPKPVGDNTTSTTSNTEPKSSESAISPPDLSNTSPGEKPDYTADTHKPTPNSGGLVGERAGHGGPSSGIDSSNQGTAGEKKSSSISPSGDDDEKSGKMDKLKDKLKTKLHIGSKDH
ncbi:hypothetical protein E8E11_006607 [Didymella keratinophila]|nr:hypothetical protein E8E11_006607 [Didymella keratinophila]